MSAPVPPPPPGRTGSSERGADVDEEVCPLPKANSVTSKLRWQGIAAAAAGPLACSATRRADEDSRAPQQLSR
jgi:hypothetical protein